MTSRKPNGVVKTVYDNVRKLEKEKNRITEQKAVLDRQDLKLHIDFRYPQTRQLRLRDGSLRLWFCVPGHRFQFQRNARDSRQFFHR